MSTTTPATVDEAPESPTTDARIIEVATELFYERGYHGVTMREIAAGVGIKAGSLYNHFPGKQEILLRIGVEATRPLHEGALERVAAVEGVDAQLDALIRWHVAYHCVRRWGCRVIDTQLHALDPDNRSALVELRDAHEQILRDILKRGQDEGRWEVDDVGVVAIAIFSMCSDVAAWYREDGRLTPDQVSDIYAGLVRRSLGGRKRRTAAKPARAARSKKSA